LVRRHIVYGPDGFEHIDYGEVRPNEEYGGEYDGEHYCYECSDIVTLAEKEEEAGCE
jgi:hypothetical protein